MQIIPVISPVSPEIKRPLWSVMIPAYNCSIYLRRTLKSVLSQDPGADQMQIEVVDDCSTDDNVRQLVEEIGGGRILYYRHTTNVGSLKNFETCLQRARGKIIHLLHGDDIIQPDYYVKMTKLFTDYPEVKIACSNYNYINSADHEISRSPELMSRDGILTNWLEILACQQKLQYCCVSVKREVYEDLGGFYGVHYGEDWEMWVRMATKYEFAYTNEILASYRLHDRSISERYSMSGQNIQDLKWAIDRIEEHVPIIFRDKIKKRALRNVSIKLIINGFFLWKRTRNAQVGIQQIHGALKLHFDFYVVFVSSWSMLSHIYFKFIKIVQQKKIF